MGQGSALPSEIGKLQEFLTSNSESFADMFGMSEDDFKAWAGDANNLTENFGKLQQAIEGNSGAINELRDEIGSLGTHGQELVDELAGSWDKCNDKVKAFSDWMNDSTSLTKNIMQKMKQLLMNLLHRILMLYQIQLEYLKIHLKNYIKKIKDMLVKLLN